jgi:hypothetical protein
MRYLENFLDYCTYTIGVLLITFAFAVAQGIINIEGVPPLAIFILAILVIAAVSITVIERRLSELTKT